MKKAPFLILLVLSHFGYGQTKQKVTDQDKLNQCINKYTRYFTFNGASPAGEGWLALESLFAENQFVAWGEYHNSPLIAKLTTYALESAARKGYRTWCVEISPFVAAELTRISRMQHPADTLVKLFSSGYPGIGVFPFFSTATDAKMLTAAARLGFTTWGIDQEFQMSFPYCLQKVYQAQPRKIKQRYKSVYDSLQARWWYPDTKLLDSLNKVVGQPRLRKVLSEIAISKEIYNSGDNAGRATLMKNNFFRYYDAGPVHKKVFFKMGSNHLARGINLQTNLYDIGNAVYELAQRNKTGFANVLFMVRYTTEAGKVTDDAESEESNYPPVFSRLYREDRWVLVDIRSLRAKMRYDNSLTRDTYQVIEKYDYVLVSPEVMK